MAVIDARDIVVGFLLAGPKDDDRPVSERYEACGPRILETLEQQTESRPKAWTKGLGGIRGDFSSLTVGINYNFHEKVMARKLLLRFLH